MKMTLTIALIAAFTAVGYSSEVSAATRNSGSRAASAPKKNPNANEGKTGRPSGAPSPAAARKNKR